VWMRAPLLDAVPKTPGSIDSFDIRLFQ